MMRRVVLLVTFLLVCAGSASAQSGSDGWNVAIYPVFGWIPLDIDIKVDVPPFDNGTGGGSGSIVDGRFDGAFLGGGSTFHQFMHIGRLVMVQGSSAFGKDLPPFVVAAERNFVFGLNIIGLRRAGVGEKDRDEIKAAFKLVYLSGLNTSQALKKADTLALGAVAREFLDFVANSKKRGICALKRGRGDDVSL